MSALVAVVPAPAWETYRPLGSRVGVDIERTEPCACGGRIVQLVGQSAPAVVADHNATTRHGRWRERTGL